MEKVATILIVDDNIVVLHTTRHLLVEEGYHVLTASDGVEALKILETQPVDLILADIMMPNMNGYDLYAQVVGNPKWVSIPFVFLTALTQDSSVHYGKELGADDYLTKPISSRELLAVVRGKLRRAKQVARSSAGPTTEATEIQDVMIVGSLRIEVGQYRVWLRDELVKLSTAEFRLLEHLAVQADGVVPLQELIQVTHGLQTDYREASGLLRPLVRSLRRKLGYPAGDMGCIEAVRGVGYRLIPPDDTQEHSAGPPRANGSDQYRGSV